MNIEGFSKDDSQFRNRFGGSRRTQTKWEIAEKTASDAASYLRDSFDQFRNFKTPPYVDDFKKKNFRDNVRYYAAYLGLFLVAVLVVALFVFSGYSSSSSSATYSDYSDESFSSFSKSVESDSQFSFDNLAKHISDKVHRPVKDHKNWRQKIFDLRPTDVINHKYDNFVISIMVADVPTENHLLQSSFKTFLRQINRIQICTDKIANTFVGGDHYSDLPFEPKSIAFPKLERYIDGFLTMNLFSPHQEWYMQVDEDSYLFLENIYIYLQKYQSSDALFFHNFDLVREGAVHYEPKESGHFPVSIMSRRAAEILAQSEYGDCILRNKYIASEETIMIKCLESFGIKTVVEKGLHPSEPSHDFAWPIDSCKRPLSISQLNQQQLQYLYNAKPTTGSSSHDGSAYKWDSIATYSDVFHHTFSTTKPAAGIDRHSASDSKTLDNVKSGMECMEACKADLSCVSWTFDRTSCFTSDHIGVSIPRDGVVSGLVPSRYNCLAPQ